MLKNLLQKVSLERRHLPNDSYKTYQQKKTFQLEVASQEIKDFFRQYNFLFATRTDWMNNDTKFELYLETGDSSKKDSNIATCKLDVSGIDLKQPICCSTYCS